MAVPANSGKNDFNGAGPAVYRALFRELVDNTVLLHSEQRNEFAR